MIHLLIISICIAVVAFAHHDYTHTHNKEDVVIEEIAEEVLHMEGVPLDIKEQPTTKQHEAKNHQ